MENYKVYVHINKSNGKRYVGLTSTPLKRRWDNGLGYAPHTIFGGAIKKYGFDGFEHELIADGLTKEEAEAMEKEYIAKWNTTNRDFGYNDTKGGEGFLQHGGSGTRLYHIWSTTLGNANLTKENVDVCEDWKNFDKFRDWAMNNGYSDNLRIFRKNLDDGFHPSNCRWATIEEVASNAHSRDLRMIEFNGESHTLTEWAKITGINKQTLQMRLDSGGWGIERALTENTDKHPIVRENSTGLPHHISEKRQRFEVCVQKKGKRYRKTFATLDEAVGFRDNLLNNYESL